MSERLRTHAPDFKFAQLAAGAASAGPGLYFTVCPQCPAQKRCFETRIDSENFFLTAKQRRKLQNFKEAAEINDNRSLLPPELYTLFQDYQKGRHGWDRYKAEDIAYTFRAVCDNNARIFMARQSNKIIAAAFVDEDGHGNIHGDILIYSLDPAVRKLSPGISMLLHIASWAKEHHPQGKVYLGSWNAGPKLRYKSQFKGLEYFYDGQWQDNQPPPHPGQPTPAPHSPAS